MRGLSYLLFCALLTTVLLYGCKAGSSQEYTGIPEVDQSIETAVQDDAAKLIPYLKFRELSCSFADGLGGPPKCKQGEAEGDPVSVLPVIGPEGHFIREEEIENWTGVNVSELFAVYIVSEAAYSDQNYPAGEYAIVFIGGDEFTNVTMQVKDGEIVRLDYGYGNPPVIPDVNIEEYIFLPGIISK
jgi:hypothetical protein